MLYDDRDDLPELMDAVVDSIVDFHLWRTAVVGAPPGDDSAASGAADEATWTRADRAPTAVVADRAPPSAVVGSMVDDIASMVHPAMWEAIVLPSWERYFRGITSGRRTAHVEDLRREQLPFLERIGLSSFDPSISHKLSPPLIAATIRVPFGWRLGCFHYQGLDEVAVRDWVLAAAADGASSVFTIVAESMCDGDSHVGRIHAFADAGGEVADYLAAGGARAALRERMSHEGRHRFWRSWPERVSGKAA
jgi:hypothetical protein